MNAGVWDCTLEAVIGLLDAAEVVAGNVVGLDLSHSSRITKTASEHSLMETQILLD